MLTDPRTTNHYAGKLRRVRFRGERKNEAWTYLTNDLTLLALTVAKLYRSRWQAELFLKWTPPPTPCDNNPDTGGQRRVDADMGRRHGLRPRRHRSQAPRIQAQSLHTLEDLERPFF